ncbi:tyrosine-type recombinase/integrase [Burkholderia pseudomallei]|uniref:Phage integrase n=2 Tax=Pseudomonadota TaxID=1224 RepID=Q63RT4_BURPS|nr:site-specific integrase [Burkholderia pseudomallei]MBF3555890.1 integrase arm-type DNA-binding domain-containing protein [Burkholderia pseudomallei]MBF4040403.1 integrase arm-type DNA-binding domain-containing protein [Burkholderia pseudomallei]MDE3325603.1 integrase arm-type DNA-binding domain-containing protein [Burkholderia pseudomallei]MDY7814127.1 integrase arm-type DNA-binding domain-containing protein [Burkholderia pseudomallei]MDY7862809.1 integrase arm-type DNA-binding domain-conta
MGVEMITEAKRKIHRLSAIGVEKAKAPGYLGDGGGLYLQVSPSLTKSWIFRFKLHGRSREMGLGPYTALSLAEARKRAEDCRRLLLDGVDPIEARKGDRLQQKLQVARSMTFADCASTYIAAHRDAWKNAKHAQQWENTIETYANPVIGKLPIQDVDTNLVVRILDPIWREKPETASRLRGRIEAILNWAKTRELRRGENPARWRGHLENLLAKRSRARSVRHHPALPYEEIGAFVAELRQQEGVAARALEFTILTAARTGEVIGATLDEFDDEQRVWTVPAGRMKGERAHRVPLSPQAVRILKEMRSVTEGPSLFPGRTLDKPLSNMAMLVLLRRMGRGDLTVHGFRSTFRDWSSELTGYPREVAEAALAHAVGDQVEAAYRRGDLFAKRRQMMEAWAKYCDTPKRGGDVVPMRRKASSRQ